MTGVGIYWWQRGDALLVQPNPSQANSNAPENLDAIPIANPQPNQKTTTTPPTTEIKIQTLTWPVADFESRVTKKPFGIYITPQTSPIQPERFSGYHAGADAEYADITTDVPVMAITDGAVLFSGYINGYGGVVITKHPINDIDYQVLYGHLNPSSLAAKGKTVKVGEQIGILGKDKSAETDGERKHLHLSIYTGTDLNFRGYVQSQNELNKWLDPLTIF